jgi:hypothetical protein
MSSSTSTCFAVEVLEDAHDAGGAGRRAVGGDGHELHLRRDLQGPREVAHEQHRTLEDPDEENLLAGVVGGDLRCKLTDLGPDLLLGQEHVVDVRAVAVVGTERSGSRG